MFFIKFYVVFFFKQKTAYEMRISDWSSDVCSSDLLVVLVGGWPVRTVPPELTSAGMLGWRGSMRLVVVALRTTRPDSSALVSVDSTRRAPTAPSTALPDSR